MKAISPHSLKKSGERVGRNCLKIKKALTLFFVSA
jgi:hypothetical protein